MSRHGLHSKLDSDDHTMDSMDQSGRSLKFKIETSKSGKEFKLDQF